MPNQKGRKNKYKVNKMKIAITGGGTGGHLNIAKCLLSAASELKIPCIYIGSQSGQDKKWFENEPNFSQKYFLPSSSVVDKKGLAKLKSLFFILKLSLKARKILKDEKISAVFSVGGYSAAAACFGALLTKTPLFIHEQNSKSGSLNALLKPFAKGFYSAFCKDFTPYPVADKFFDTARLRKHLQSIIFLGGSQGASFINDLALKIASKLDSKGVKIIHQCGEKDYERCVNFYQKAGINADVFAFCDNLQDKMHTADLAISRSGASTLFELCANALPAVFVPYPFAAKNHQFFNAKFLQDKALCQIFTQDELKKDEKCDYKGLLNAIFAMNLGLISSELQLLGQGFKGVKNAKNIEKFKGVNAENTDFQALFQKNGAKILLEKALEKLDKKA